MLPVGEKALHDGMESHYIRGWVAVQSGWVGVAKDGHLLHGVDIITLWDG